MTAVLTTTGPSPFPTPPGRIVYRSSAITIRSTSLVALPTSSPLCLTELETLWEQCPAPRITFTDPALWIHLSFLRKPKGWPSHAGTGVYEVEAENSAGHQSQGHCSDRPVRFRQANQLGHQPVVI